MLALYGMFSTSIFNIVTTTATNGTATSAATTHFKKVRSF